MDQTIGMMKIGFKNTAEVNIVEGKHDDDPAACNEIARIAYLH
jgi:hypothetical protein